MPVARFEMPDGRIARFEVPEGTTPEQAQAMIAQMVEEQGVPEPPQQPVPTQAPAQPSSPGFFELSRQMSGGIVEPLLSLATSGIGEIGGGLSGLGTLALTGDPAAAEAVRAGVAETLTYEPRTAGGALAQQVIGAPSAPAGALMQEAEQIAGEAGYEAGGPIGGALASALPTAASMLAGGALNRAITPTRGPGGALAVVDEAQVPPPALGGLPESRRAIGEEIAAGSTSERVAPYRLEEWAGVAKNPAANEAIRQGADKSVVAAISRASPVDRTKMRDMLNIMRDVRGNKRLALDKRPSDVVGDSLTERVRHVINVNKQAGKRVNEVAKNLKGEVVNFQPAVQSFIDDLSEIGVRMEGTEPRFKGSDIEGATAAENFISKVVTRMRDTGTPSAYDVHRLKKFIDEQVSYGKVGEGLTGQAERIVKRLRANLDNALDEQFSEYNEANTTYAETIGALDSLQSIAGKRMDFSSESANKALGTLLRRLTSNAQTRVPLSDAIGEIEGVANKYGGKFKDDIKTQMVFANELDRMFGPVADTSLMGDVSKAVARGALDVATGQPGGAVRAGTEGVLSGVLNKIQGIDPERGMTALDELLKSQ